LFAIGSLAGGGSERQLINILRHVDRSQFEPHLYLVSRSGEFLSQVPDDVPVTAFDHDPLPSGIYLPGRIRRAQIAHFAKTLSNQRTDVVYDRTPHMTLIAGPACRRTGIPHVSAVVSNPVHDLRDNIGRFGWFKKQILRKSYRTAARVIANSDPLARECREFYGLAQDQVAVISNGFDFDEIQRLAGVGTDNADTVRSTSTFHIVAAGRLEECKGFDLLFGALNELVNVRDHISITATIAGRGGAEAELKHLAAQHCLEQVVDFAGFLQNPYPLIQSADLFCLTSRYEGMPNVLVEAMSLGVPVLATDCPHGPRDILLDGKLGTLVANVDSHAIADGIERVMNRSSAGDDADRTEAAQESVLSRFGIEATTRTLEELLAAVARQES
jgi:glycosyltransferase involved in cell wall biosynthesis